MLCNLLVATARPHPMNLSCAACATFARLLDRTLPCVSATTRLCAQRPPELLARRGLVQRARERASERVRARATNVRASHQRGWACMCMHAQYIHTYACVVLRRWSVWRASRRPGAPAGVRYPCRLYTWPDRTPRRRQATPALGSTAHELVPPAVQPALGSRTTHPPGRGTFRLLALDESQSARPTVS